MARATPSKAILVILLLIGLLLGSIIGDILGKLGVPYVFESKEIRWSPAGDLLILVWDIDIILSINLASAIGLGIAFWIYRRL
ncbi:DUF4321 domain-containing protein [Desulfuribacillus alkaliarsenatis]|uniref:DUF4321 domain-containing protein n=1 Tax=Desulfuribacillus alkaliarsenatis TaxID=766136 RepID=A0A1E5G5A8_9FIRM|nr:DUF4321 domain-containing protein [Desulfuribacillus alkaliarsenatis]OEF98343.1 hypothetical protein BHF68_01295 [Desulfuribacillus alkaliarsenatis]